MEVNDDFPPVVQDVPSSGIVIDLTASSPPVFKEEPTDDNTSFTAGDKGKACMNDIIDLTMESDDDDKY